MARGMIFGLVVAIFGLGLAALVLGPVEMAPPGDTPQAGTETPESPAMEVAPDVSAPETAEPEPMPELAEPEAMPETTAPEEHIPEVTEPEAMEPDSMAPEEAAPTAGIGTAEPEAAAPAAEPTGESAMTETPDTMAPEATAPAADPASDEGVLSEMPASSEMETPSDEGPAPSDEMLGGDQMTAPTADLGAEQPGTDILDDSTPPDPAAGVVTGRLPSIGDAPAPAAESGARLAPVAPLAPVATPTMDASGVVTGRLPSIGNASEEVVADPAPAAVDLPALERNAIIFDTIGGQPLLSLLLLDTGGDRSAMQDLGKLPFPVSVAVNAGTADAAGAIDFYRAQGAEVVLIVPLPEGATATDVEVTMEAYAPLFDQAVAAMAEPEAGFQTLGDGAVQFATHLTATGHGLVSFPEGLNTGHKAALKEGVHAGLVFRDLDGEGQGGSVVRRFLDNAAFRARNEHGVIVVGRTQAETVQAMLEWSLGTRAQSVTLAPVSAVLMTQ